MVAVKPLEVKLSALLKEECTELDIKEKDKTKLIGELAALIARSLRGKDKKVFFNALLKRERLGSTAIGNGVAIPHAKIEGIKKVTLAFGRSLAGVDFSALDGEKTYLFFVLISPVKDVGVHLKILAKIAHLLQDKFAVYLLKKARTKKEIFKVISDIEKSI